MNFNYISLLPSANLVVQRSIMKMFLAVLFVMVAMTMADKPFTCPPIWTLYRGHCYRYFGGRLSWDDAQTHCERYFTERGVANLVSIHDREENALVYEIFRSARSPRTPTNPVSPINALT